jgi:hypothetical protein
MAALERAGGTPISNRDLHAFAYLANVLSPIWEVEPLEGSVLKDREGPRSSALEREIDLCVGEGLLTVVKLIQDAENPDKLDAWFRLAAVEAAPILASVDALPDEREVRDFLNELAFAFVDIKADRRDDAALVDAAWSDPAVAEGRVIDFAEFVEASRKNPAYNAAQAFQRFAPAGVTLSRAEKLVMYMRLLKRRANG